MRAPPWSTTSSRRDGVRERAARRSRDRPRGRDAGLPPRGRGRRPRRPVTHVVRGADHYSNTPKHVRIYEALGAQPPTYAHLPLLHGTDGKKLSKRHGAASVSDLRKTGYLREAVINYLALLGWGYDETTSFSPFRSCRSCSPRARSKNPAVFDEQKLRWINGRYLRELSNEDLTSRLEEFTGRTGLKDAVAITQEKISTLDEFWPLAQSFFEVRPTTRRRVRSS